MTDDPKRFARAAAQAIREWAMQIPEEPWSDDDEEEAEHDIHTLAVEPAVRAAKREVWLEIETYCENFVPKELGYPNYLVLNIRDHCRAKAEELK